MPYLLPSRPNPLCFTPPNLIRVSKPLIDHFKLLYEESTYGDAASLIRPVLTPIMPTFKASATRNTRAISLLKK